ncbi:hypothetical protein AAG747_03770 [Rapidithrix thailandica]|uniref:DUF6892 domain-containing protein n=1 Tax=Rapidithrix thailandica TaxID=413964 RepID=A0AAW9S3P8_9BACT
MKDLLYAIKTQNFKKITRELERFPVDSLTWATFEELLSLTLQLVENTPFQDKGFGVLEKQLNIFWVRCSEKGAGYALHLYDTVLNRLEQTHWDDEQEAAKGYKTLSVFKNDKIGLYSKNIYLRAALRENSSRILEIAEHILTLEDRQIVQSRKPSHTGTLGEIVEFLLDIYFYHCKFMGDEDLRASAADYVIPMAKKFPKQGNNLTLSLVKEHPDCPKIISELIHYYLNLDLNEDQSGLFYSIALAVLSANGSGSLFKKIPKILKHLAPLSATWREQQWEYFAENFVYYPLEDEKAILHFLERSKQAFALVELIVNSSAMTPKVQALRDLFQKAVQNPPSKKKNPKAVAPKGVSFRSVNFKLAVLDELMYTMDVLQPKFDIREFACSQAERIIDIEEEGYTIVPEAMAFFEELPVSENDLAQVESLYFDGGLDIYRHIYPFFGGEEDYFDIDSLEDIALLKNLKSLNITSMVDASCSLKPLKGQDKLEQITLDVVTYQNMDTLLELPSLRHITTFKNVVKAYPELFQQLQEKGIEIKVNS